MNIQLTKYIIKIIVLDFNNNLTLDNLPSLSPEQLKKIAEALGMEIAPGIGANLSTLNEEFKTHIRFILA